MTEHRSLDILDHCTFEDEFAFFICLLVVVRFVLADRQWPECWQGCERDSAHIFPSDLGFTFQTVDVSHDVYSSRHRTFHGLSLGDVDSGIPDKPSVDTVTKRGLQNNGSEGLTRCQRDRRDHAGLGMPATVKGYRQLRTSYAHLYTIMPQGLSFVRASPLRSLTRWWRSGQRTICSRISSPRRDIPYASCPSC